MSGFLLGVDGGGTKTLARIASEESSAGPSRQFCLHGVGHAAGSNPLSLGYAPAQAAISQSVAQACESASIQPEQISGGLLAIAGAKSADVATQLQAWVLDQSWGKGCRVVADTAPLLPPIDRHPSAIAVVAGTGSVVLARGPSGVVHTVGGWGYLVGDEGSGYALGKAALCEALQELESQGSQSRPLSPFTQGLLTHIGSDSNQTALAFIKTYVYGCENPRERIAALTRYVTPLASAGDPTAGKIVDQLATDLAAQILRAGRMAELATQPFSLSLVGGLLLGCSRLRHALLGVLNAEGLAPTVVEPLPDVASACFALIE